MTQLDLPKLSPGNNNQLPIPASFKYSNIHFYLSILVTFHHKLILCLYKDTFLHRNHYILKISLKFEDTLKYREKKYGMVRQPFKWIESITGRHDRVIFWPHALWKVSWEIFWQVASPNPVLGKNTFVRGIYLQLWPTYTSPYEPWNIFLIRKMTLF